MQPRGLLWPRRNLRGKGVENPMGSDVRCGSVIMEITRGSRLCSRRNGFPAVAGK